MSELQVGRDVDTLTEETQRRLWQEAVPTPQPPAAPATCATCTYWGGDTPSNVWGKCHMPLRYQAPVLSDDGILTTRAEFGCNQHKPRGE